MNILVDTSVMVRLKDLSSQHHQETTDSVTLLKKEGV